ncbi:MAG TPA: 2-oxoacid:acceptor oxidoreductase subunit alpha [Fibrobacteraceae bacterium]|nr:2-oxoacid:acceptor oxidoreductase subunit alpha [Fibrobacteraceae bacterium]
MTKIVSLPEHIVEIVSDAGEGAQKAGTTFAEVCARSGNGLWTVEIIPSEIQPPPHTTGSASGNRIRLASRPLTNGGDLTHLVVAFNEMALLSRIQVDALDPKVIVLIDNQWATHADPQIRKQYREILDELIHKGGQVWELPIEVECQRIAEDTSKGKNMFVTGMLVSLYNKDLSIAKTIVREVFHKKTQAVIEKNIGLLEAGFAFGSTHFETTFQVAPMPSQQAQVAMNGNTALALGAIAAGYELCAMYPITPATSASHELAAMFEDFGGMVHQSEDEIAAIGVAVGSNWAGKPALTITSGPGLALKTEFQGLTVMSETPLVLIDVQRGGPSTGLPTKVEQGDLLAALYGAPGDTPKVIIAPSSIEECFQIMPLARRISEEFRALVIILSDANLATGRQLFPRPQINVDLLSTPLDLSPVPPGTKPFDWDPETGLSQRILPGRPGGMWVATGLNHTDTGKINYLSAANQKGMTMRSRKLAVLQSTLKVPEIFGKSSGDLLLVSWGSTRGAIWEAVERAQAQGTQVSAMNIQFLSPLPPGLKAAFQKFKKVMTVELNYGDQPGDPYITEENRRYTQLATLLRARTLVDVDCWGRVPGRPLRPSEVQELITREIDSLKEA